jgi:uncharacterized cupin superfamily protein
MTDRIVPPDRVREAPSGEGWSEAVLADADVIGAHAMVLRRLTLEPRARTSERERSSGGEEFLYVIRGDGVAFVGDAGLALAPETVVWLEEPDRSYRLEAGENGLEVLIAHGPGG